MSARKLAAIAAMVCIAAMIACPARPADTSDPGVATMKGLHGVQVIVENVQPNLVEDGLSQGQVHDNVEDQLKKAGITVLDDDGFKTQPILVLIFASTRT